jgi:hypothetical protein
MTWPACYEWASKGQEMTWADHTGSTDRRSLLSLTSGGATKAQRWGVLLSCQVSVLQSQRTHTQSARWHLPKPVPLPFSR